MPQSFLWIIGIILASGLVSGSQGKGGSSELKSNNRKNRNELLRPRAESEGHLSSGSSKDPKKYASDVLDRLHYRESDIRDGRISIAPLREQHSHDSLSGLVDNSPRSPDLKVSGTHDGLTRRLGFVRRSSHGSPRIASWDQVKSPSDDNEEKEEAETLKKKTSRKQRRHSESTKDKSSNDD